MIVVSRDRGCSGSRYEPSGLAHGSQVIMGTAPSAATRSTQSVRNRTSPLRHCWNQWTICGGRPAASVHATVPATGDPDRMTPR